MALSGGASRCGFSISNEDQNRESELRVVDPDVDPVLTLDSSREAEMQLMVHRLAVARALGMIGLSDAAMEVSLPANVLEAGTYLKPVERRRARQKLKIGQVGRPISCVRASFRKWSFGIEVTRGELLQLNFQNLVEHPHLTQL